MNHGNHPMNAHAMQEPKSRPPTRRCRPGVAACWALALMSAPALADQQQEELWTVRETVFQMLEQMVAKGTLTREEADAMIERAHEQAARRVAEYEPEPDDVRVAYVPEFVKDEIREAVKRELQADVVDEVLTTARRDQWGVPGALPRWVDRLTFHGDLRARAQSVLYDSGNAQTTALQTNPYRNVQAINEAGSQAAAGLDAFLNTTVDDHSARIRLRFGVEAQLSEHFTAGVRFATGNGKRRVSRNYVFGTQDNNPEFVVDQAYVRYSAGERYPWLVASAGRIATPFVGTDIIWDDDLSWDGAALSARYNFAGESGRERSVFLTAAGFALEQFTLEEDDKYLYGAQAGLNWTFGESTTLTVAGAWYDFENIVGVRNDFESTLNDFTAPSYVQKGNTVFNIRNSADISLERLALASDFELVNGTVMLDFGNLFFFGEDIYSPIHLQLIGDWVRNIGFDAEEIAARTGVRPPARDEGYQLELNFGRPQIRYRGDWRIRSQYRHLEGDAVVDGYSDGAFHLGGTDHEGYAVMFDLGLASNAWFTFEYYTADEIDQAPLAIDILRLDISARF